MKNTQLTTCLMVKDWKYHNLRLKARPRYLLPSLLFDNILEDISGQLGRKKQYNLDRKGCNTIISIHNGMIFSKRNLNTNTQTSPIKFQHTACNGRR